MNGLFLKFKNKYTSLSIGKKSVIWFTLATIIQNGIQFLVTPIYTRVLTDFEYGLYSLFQSWQQVFAIVIYVALDRCITVGFMKYAENRKHFLSSIQTLMTILAIISSTVIMIFPSVFEKITTMPLYMIITMVYVSLMNNSLSNWSWYQRYISNYKLLTFTTISTTLIIQLVSVSAVVYLPFQNKGNILVMSSSMTRMALYGVIYVYVYFTGKTFYKKDYWRFGLKYSVSVVPHALSQIILSTSDRILIERISGSAETAFYSVTYSAAMVLNTLINSVSTAIQPWFFQKIKDNDFVSIKDLTNLFLSFSAALVLFISLFAPEIISIMAPPSYSKAVFVFPSIAASMFFNSMYLCFANFESYFEKPIYFSIATSTGAVLNIILNLALIPIFGFVAAGYTTLVCYILFAIMHYYFMKKVCLEFLNNQKVYDLRFLLFLSISVIILSIITTLSYRFTIVRYAIIFVIITFALIFKNKILIITRGILGSKTANH